MKNVLEIGLEDIVAKAKDFFQQGYRFVTIDCIQMGDDRWQLLYHFDKDLELSHVRITFDGLEVPSISPVYTGALLVENEIQDLFGLKFTDLVIDYQGRLFLTDEVGPAPQVISNMTVIINEKPKGEVQVG